MRVGEGGIDESLTSVGGIIAGEGRPASQSKPQDAKGVLAVDGFAAHHLRHTWATRDRQERHAD